jgi:hypothetical protein
LHYTREAPEFFPNQGDSLPDSGKSQDKLTATLTSSSAVSPALNISNLIVEIEAMAISGNGGCRIGI